MSYCLDANIFIQAKNRHYAMDFCPAFWDFIIQQSDTGSVFSIIPIYDELVKGRDELAEWAKEHKASLFIDISDTETQERFAEIADHVIQNYSEEETAHFLSGADPWLIAKAITTGSTLVTHEVLAPGAKKVKIPNICQVFSVTYVSPFEMLRGLKASFVLST